MDQLSDHGFLLARDEGSPARRPGFSAWENSSARGFLSDVGQGHVMVFAPTEAGKKRNILGPTLLTSRDPAIVMDIKGELARETADFRRDEFGHQVVILDPWKEVTDDPDSFNPLDTLDGKSPNLADDAQSQAQLFVPLKPSREAYWDDRAQVVFSGLIAHVVECEKEEVKSFGRVWRLLNSDDPIHGLATLLDSMPCSAFARAQIGSMLSVSADTTRSCILSVAQQHCQVFASEAVQAAVSKTTFDLDAVRRGEPITIYIVVPPAKLRSHATLVRLWLSTLLNLILQRKVKPKRPTLLLLDEIAQLGAMEQIPMAVTLARGYGLRCMLLLQSYAQLRQAYPIEHEVMIENCASLVTFGHTAFSMSRQLSDALGDISPDTLFGMNRQQVAVRTAGQTTRIMRRVDYLNDPELAGRASDNPMFSK